MIDYDAQIRGGRRRLWNAHYQLGSTEFSEQDSLDHTCLLEPAERVTTFDLEREIGTVLSQSIKDAERFDIVTLSDTKSLACIPAKMLVAGIHATDSEILINTFNRILRYRYASESWDTLLSTAHSYSGLQRVGDTIVVGGSQGGTGIVFITYSTNAGVSWMTDTLRDNIAFYFAFVGTKAYISSQKSKSNPRVQVASWTPGAGQATTVIDSSIYDLPVTPTKFFEGE